MGDHQTMAIKKSELYSSIWASCDQLRGGMDASQYKDYVLFMLFIKYISDKYGDSDDIAPLVKIPRGAGFADMVKLKGKSDIGDKINKQVIQPLIDANEQLGYGDFPDFDDSNKLGEGAAKTARLTNLIAIFQKPELDFSKNHADHDDILGDAYEYLMRHFATESGKSKGQFYTPAEVSRVIAQVIGISPQSAKASTTAYDPTCGSGSLLLKVAARAGREISLYGQEKDVTTAGLARMNMILHNFPTAKIMSGNTLAAPKFTSGKNDEHLRTFDYVVANPPFSDKTWSTGITPPQDAFQRFGWGEPPAKQGDYAYLLHIIRSMKSEGKGACILPHGVLFRGNAEAAIRKELVGSGYLKGVIGMPANLFYGTGIPACIIVLDKENATAREGVFMIDASKGFVKDGNKNRLREQDIHRIVDTFANQKDIPRYARMVTAKEIESNGFNLNLPRYIDSAEPEDIQDIGGHLRGGIPTRDVDSLDNYWQALPGVRESLFQSAGRKGYAKLRPEASEIKSAIFNHNGFTAFQKKAAQLFANWRKTNTPRLDNFQKGGKPAVMLDAIAEELLAKFRSAPLLDGYDIYQHLMDYRATTMQDDVYLIAAEGWARAAQSREFLPEHIVVNRYFAAERDAIEDLDNGIAVCEERLAEMREEHGGEDGMLANSASGENGKQKFTDKSLLARLQEIENDPRHNDECEVIYEYLASLNRLSDYKLELKEARKKLNKKIDAKYSKLTERDIKALVIDDKWMAHLADAVRGEVDSVAQTLSARIRELAERYDAPLTDIAKEVNKLTARVDQHLQKMGAL